MSNLVRVPSKRQIYDAVIVGSQLGGALAAALLARRGIRVLVIGHDGIADTYTDGGYVLPFGPSLMPPLKGLPVADAAFTELGMATDLGRTLTPYDPELQILLPGHRFDLSRDAGLRQRELAREFQDAAAAEKAWTALSSKAGLAEPFWRDLQAPFPAENFWTRWKLGRRVKALPELQEAMEAGSPEGHPLAAVGRALTGFLTHLSPEPKPGLGAARVLGQFLRGPQKLAYGRDGLRAMLLKRVKELGGDVLGLERPAQVDALQLEGRRISGVKLVGADAVYAGQQVVLATDVAGIGRLAPTAQAWRSWRAWNAVKQKQMGLSVNLVVDEGDVPLGLQGLGVLWPQDESLGMLVYEVHPAPRTGSKGPPTDRVVSAMALVPSDLRRKGDEPAIASMAGRIASAIKEVLPFVPIKHQSVPMLVRDPLRGSRLSLHPVFEVSGPMQLGVSGLPMGTPFRNALLASREVLPGLGLEGELLVGYRVAERLTEKLKRKSVRDEP